MEIPFARYKNQSQKQRLTLFASDGELYGHHQHFRDLFLSYILGPGSQNNNISWTYPDCI